jgi:hypothetical protein
MSAVRKQLYYIWKKLSERSSRKKFRTVYFKNDLERFQGCKMVKPAAQMKREMKTLHRYWGCYPFQYYRFDFYKQDCPLTVEEMKTYVPLFFLHHLYFPLSYKEYGVVCEDKLLTYAMLKAYEVPQPKLLFCFDHNTFFDGANNPVTTAEADAVINAASAKTLFVKPRFGSEGKGIAIFNKKDGVFRNDQNTVLDHTFFEKDAGDRKIPGRDASGFYIVQEGLTQHDELSRIYPQAVNTYRIITEYINGDARVLYCVVRLGSGGRQIDNASAGGIFVRINLDTGALYDSAQAFDQSTCTKHPDTGFIFKDAVMQTWTETKAFTLAAARKFREIRYIGWDIAVTKDGPAVIEFNNKPDMAGVQDSYGGIRDHWKINPKDWWYLSNYTLKNL